MHGDRGERGRCVPFDRAPCRTPGRARRRRIGSRLSRGSCPRASHRAAASRRGPQSPRGGARADAPPSVVNRPRCSAGISCRSCSARRRTRTRWLTARGDGARRRWSCRNRRPDNPPRPRREAHRQAQMRARSCSQAGRCSSPRARPREMPRDRHRDRPSRCRTARSPGSGCAGRKWAGSSKMRRSGHVDLMARSLSRS